MFMIEIKRRYFMNRIVLGIIILCLTVLASGQAAAFGEKITALSPDLGFPLSAFAPIGGVAPVTGQNSAWIAYWDIGTTPNYFDDADVAYLQFGSSGAAANKIVRANNIRLTAWGVYALGSQVAAGEADIGQQVIPLAPGSPNLLSGPTNFYYLNIVGGPGYDLGDPVYLKTQLPITVPPTLGTNDLRITANGAYLAGSRVSLADSDAGKALTVFYGPIPAAGGPTPTGPPAPGSIGQLAFFNTNGNIDAGTGFSIYDAGDLVYFDVAPLGLVSPNDIRLW
jgi:hypothetical protein